MHSVNFTEATGLLATANGIGIFRVILDHRAKHPSMQHEALHKVIERSPTLGPSMERLFNQELARKLVNSWG